jgi:hypothetical protein
MSEDCGICGLLISDKFSHTLTCNHTFHYECLMKSFQNSSVFKKQFNHCPYCRQKSDYLPLVNGLKKVLPNVHCKNTTGSIQEKKLLLKNNYSKRCEFILTKGKNKGNLCGKNCNLGYNTCKAHMNKDTNLIKDFPNNQISIENDIQINTNDTNSSNSSNITNSNS